MSGQITVNLLTVLPRVPYRTVLVLAEYSVIRWVMTVPAAIREMAHDSEILTTVEWLSVSKTNSKSHKTSRSQDDNDGLLDSPDLQRSLSSATHTTQPGIIQDNTLPSLDEHSHTLSTDYRHSQTIRRQHENQAGSIDVWVRPVSHSRIPMLCFRWLYAPAKLLYCHNS